MGVSTYLFTILAGLVPFLIPITQIPYSSRLRSTIKSNVELLTKIHGDELLTDPETEFSITKKIQFDILQLTAIPNPQKQSDANKSANQMGQGEGVKAKPLLFKLNWQNISSGVLAGLPSVLWFEYILFHNGGFLLIAPGVIFVLSLLSVHLVQLRTQPKKVKSP